MTKPCCNAVTSEFIAGEKEQTNPKHWQQLEKKVPELSYLYLNKLYECSWAVGTTTVQSSSW